MCESYNGLRETLDRLFPKPPADDEYYQIPVELRRWFLEEALPRNTRQVGDCLEWTDYRYGTGYGGLRWGGQSWLTHRLHFACAFGDFPANLFILHSCHNPACVNLRHLRLGTQQDNLDDMVAADRQAKGSAVGGAVLIEADIPVICDRLRAGESAVAIAADFGVDRSLIAEINAGEIWRHALPAGWTPIDIATKGERNGSHKLTEEQVLMIFRLAWSGEFSLTAIAGSFGVSRGTVSFIKYGRRWSWLTKHQRKDLRNAID